MISGSELAAIVGTKSMTSFPKIKAILYDMDGLLLDTENFYTDVTQQIVSRYGKNFDWSIKSQMLGRPALESARTLVRVLELPIRPAATMQRLTSLMESHRMLVLESQPEAGSSHQVNEVVRPVIDLLADRKASSKLVSSASDGREIYEVKIRGRFQDLQSALKSLSVDLEHVVPLSLQMESLELSSSQAHQSQRIWTLKILV